VNRLLGWNSRPADRDESTRVMFDGLLERRGCGALPLAKTVKDLCHQTLKRCSSSAAANGPYAY